MYTKNNACFSWISQTLYWATGRIIAPLRKHVLLRAASAHEQDCLYMYMYMYHMFPLKLGNNEKNHTLDYVKYI